MGSISCPSGAYARTMGHIRKLWLLFKILLSELCDRYMVSPWMSQGDVSTYLKRYPYADRKAIVRNSSIRHE